MSFDITMAQRAGGDHLRVETCVLAQKTMEVPTVPVGPVHHRGHTYSPRAKLLICRIFFFHEWWHLRHFFQKFHTE